MVVQNSHPDEFNLLPQDGESNSTIFKDVELATPKECEKFDPFKGRNINNPTTDLQTLIHLIKSTLGSGIMAMPFAFKTSGIVAGLLGGLLLAAICTHTSYILVDCAHKLYFRTRKSKMDYEEVVETAFATGPEWIRKYAKHARKFVLIWLFFSYFGACVADNVLISENYGQVIGYYLDYEYKNGTVEANVTAPALDAVPVDYSLLRTIMGWLLVPLILFNWIPDLKYLAPISMVANGFMMIVISITFYYLVLDVKPLNELSLVASITEFPQFFSITLFAMENIGVIMPLENNMKTPRNFLGACGVLNRGMLIITVIYLLFGVLGYVRYGDQVNEIITTNLRITDVAAQLVMLLIGSTVLFSFRLQFYVCQQMVWTRVKKYFLNRKILAEYSIRALLVITCVSIAIALPMIGPLVTLVGALGFSILGIIFPAVIELLVYWDIGYGRHKWRLIKNFFLIVFGVCALIFGTQYAIKNIVYKYSK